MNIRSTMSNNLTKKTYAGFMKKFSINCVKYRSTEIGNRC